MGTHFSGQFSRSERAARSLRAGSTAARLSAVLSAVGIAFLVLASGGNVGRLLVKPVELITIGPNAAEGLRFGALFLLFGSFLAFLATALAVRLVIRAQNIVAGDLVTLAAIAYVVAGLIAMLMLASIGPALIDAFAEQGVTVSEASTIAVGFDRLTSIAVTSLWQIAIMVPIGAWWIAVSRLVPWRRSIVAPVSLIVGCCALAASLLRVLGLAEVAGVAFACFLVLWIPAIWLVGDELRVPKDG